MKTSLYLIILLTALYSLLFLSCGKDNPDDEIQDPWTLVLEEYIGAGGGVIDTGGIRFEIPAGMFGQSQRIQLYSTDESAFGSNQATLLYEIRGLPESLDGIIPFRVKTNKTLNDKFYLAAGSIQYAKSTGDTVYFMTYFPATDSSGYVVGNIRFRDPLKSAISVGRSTDELEPGLESIHQGKISITVPGGMEEITTSLSHFKVFYTVPDVPVEMATYLGESLEDALEKFHSLGFSNLSFLDTYERYPIQVTFRPYNKCIGVNRKDYGSCASPGICENVNPHFDFNYNKMSDANTIAIISGHECFHMVQYCYKTTGESKNWLTEATATYTEEFFTTQPGGYIPITFTSQWYRPLVGMEAGAKFADPEQGASSSYHGYGMSAIVKYFIEHAKVEQPLKKMIESLHNNQSPVDAVFSVVPGEDFSSIWELAMADYVSKTTYPMPLLNRSFIAGELYYSLNWAKSVTLKANETTFPSVSYDLPDLSATFTNINLEGNFHPGQELYLEITSSGDPGHIHYPRYYYIYKSGTVETPLLKTPEAGNDKLQSLKSNNYSIAVLLTNSRHVSPYTEKTQVTLNINILGAPILKTGSAASISSNSAALDAVINPSGNTTSGYFEYGLTTDYGSTAPLSQSQLTGFLPVQVVAQLIDLQPNTTYHYRIRATNTLGETIGEDKSFKTLATTNLPTTATLDASDVTAYTAVLNGTINPNGITSYGEFEYGTTTAYGSFGLIYQNPVQGNQPVAVSYALQNLVSGQTYHFRLNAYHQGHTDVVHGEDKTFVTIAGGVQVGQEYQGGIVMSVEPNGIHGRIAAPADLGPATGTPWGCYHTEIAGADGVVYGTGQQNTADIVAGCPDQDIAAKLCDDLVLNGYSDWYLPSQHELFSLYSARDLVGGFNPAGWYWSSSELSADEAFILRFNDGLSGHMYKDYKLLVRAIRSF